MEKFDAIDKGEYILNFKCKLCNRNLGRGLLKDVQTNVISESEYRHEKFGGFLLLNTNTFTNDNPSFYLMQTTFICPICADKCNTRR